VAGAVFSGFAMVQTLMLPARHFLGLKDLVTSKHIENMNKIILVTGSLVGYAYAMEIFIAFYSGNDYEGFTFINRTSGPYWWAYWIMVSCNVITPQLFWFRKIRTSVMWSFVLSFFVNIGMWFERFVITVTSLHRDALVSSWDYFVPVTEVFYLLGTFGLFFTCFLLFIRFFPVIAIAEVKSVMPQANPHWEGYEQGEGHAATAPAAASGGH
jgi:molybdopterin-containing oxidoreductase family membrane subunit